MRTDQKTRVRDDFAERSEFNEEQSEREATPYDGDTDGAEHTLADDDVAAEVEEIAQKIAELAMEDLREETKQTDPRRAEPTADGYEQEKREFEQRLRRIIDARAKQAAAEAEENLLNRIRSRALRPTPLPSAASAQTRIDPRRLSKEQLRDIDVRVERGEAIRF